MFDGAPLAFLRSQVSGAQTFRDPFMKSLSPETFKDFQFVKCPKTSRESTILIKFYAYVFDLSGHINKT